MNQKSVAGGLVVASAYGYMAWALIVAGIGLRLYHYLQNAALAVDEQLIALNIAARSFVELTGPLDLAQSAAPLFLWCQRAAILMAGSNEWALRLVPLLAGSFMLPLAWNVGRRTVTPEVAMLALGLLAFSPLLIWESVFVKPYTLDALVTVVLLGLLHRVAQKPEERGRWHALMLGGIFAIGLSLPSVFLLGGIGACLLGGAVKSRSRTHVYWTILTGLVWAAVLGASALATHRDLLLNGQALARQYMHDFWGSRFFLVTDPPGLMFRAHDIASDVFRGIFTGQPGVFPRAVSIPGIGLVLGLVATLGTTVLFAQKRFDVLGVTVLPLALALAASALRIYPASARVYLWAAPLLALLIATGISSVSARLPRRIPIAILLCVILIIPGALAQRQLPTAGIKSPLALLGTPPADDSLYVYPGGVPAWLFYTTDWKSPDLNRVRWSINLINLGGPAVFFRWQAIPTPDGLAVPDSSLLNKNKNRYEMIGRSSGLAFVHETQQWASRPDPQWAAVEVHRMKAMTTPCVTMLLIDIHRAEHAALQQEIQNARGHVASHRGTQGPLLGTFVQRVCF